MSHLVCFGIWYGGHHLFTNIGIPTLRMATHEMKNNSAQMEMHLEWTDEDREAATIHVASYH